MNTFMIIQEGIYNAQQLLTYKHHFEWSHYALDFHCERCDKRFDFYPLKFKRIELGDCLSPDELIIKELIK